MRHVALIAAVLAIGCGGGAVTKNVTPTNPTSNPSPSPTQPPAPPPQPPPAPPPPIPVPPTPQIVGKGINPQLNIVANAPIVAFTVSGSTQTQAVVGQTTTTYPGKLDDLQQGHALTETPYPNGSSQNTLYIDGTQSAIDATLVPAQLQGSNIIWTDGSSLFTSAQSAPLYTAVGQILEFTVSGQQIAYVSEIGPVCDVFVNGVQVSQETGCAQDIKLRIVGGTTYVGWDDLQAVYNAQSTDGQTWTTTQIAVAQNAMGEDFAVLATGNVKIVWTQQIAGEDGSSVWESNNASIMRLSAPVKPGFSGAGNPAIAQDGSVVWLDDSQGVAAGDFAVVFDGQPLTFDPSVANDEQPVIGLLADGTRVVVWGDSVNVWMEEVPQ